MRRNIKKEIIKMKCPYCQREMTPGQVKSRYRFFFTENTSKYHTISGFDDITLSSHNLTLPRALAYHCKKCGVVVVEPGKEPD